jgi:hypothetical protein
MALKSLSADLLLMSSPRAEVPDAADLEFQPLQAGQDEAQSVSASSCRRPGWRPDLAAAERRIGCLISDSFLCAVLLYMTWTNVNAPLGGGDVDSFLTGS